MKIAVGQYTGNATDDRNISVGFQPAMVIVRCEDWYYFAVWKSTSMDSADSAYFVGVSNITNAIQSLTSTGFQVGTSDSVNSNGYKYNWIAFASDGSSDFYVGTYTGDGLDDRSITGVGFQPDLVYTKVDNTSGGMIRLKDFTGDMSDMMSGDGYGVQTDRIQAFETGGFQIGTHVRVNNTDDIYHYFAMKTSSGVFEQSSYTGDGTDDRSLSPVSFRPDFLFIKNSTDDGPTNYDTDTEVVAFNKSTAGYSMSLSSTVFMTNKIQAIESDGFEVGSDDDVNENTDTIYWAAWKADYLDELKSDTVTISESVSITSSLNINVSEDVSSIESTTTITSCNVDVIDEIGITEDTNITKIFDIDLNENISILEDLFIDSILGDVDVSDTLSLIENISIKENNFISTYDTPSIDDDITVSNVQLGNIDVYGVCSISESLTVKNTELNVDIYDVIPIQEEVDELGTIFVDISDNNYIVENIIIANTQLGGIIISDDISIAGEVSSFSEMNIAVIDSLPIHESTIEEKTLFANIYDVIPTNEDVIITNSQLGGINIYDDISIQGSLDEESTLNTYVIDDQLINEETTVINTQLGNIDVVDNLVIQENTIEEGTHNINIYDNVGIAENIETMKVNTIVVSDIVSITETSSIKNTQLGDIDKYDEIAISEYINFETNNRINTYDNTAIAENIKVENKQLDVDIFDNLPIQEDIGERKESNINVYDSIAINEDIDIVNDIGEIDIYDNISLSESFKLLNMSIVDTYDNQNINEDIDLTNILTGIEVYDNILIQTVAPIIKTRTIDIYDTVNVGEYNNVRYRTIVGINKNKVILTTTNNRTLLTAL